MLDLQKIIENSQNIKVGINLSDPYLPVLKAREEAEEFVFYMEQYGRAMQGITKIGQEIIDQYQKTPKRDKK